MEDSPTWIDEVMAVVEDVDWPAVKHAYGSAEHAPLALRTWLSGDDRSFDEVDEHDELWSVIADYESSTVADSALRWIYVSVFHQGSLYSASAPTCRVMVAALEHSPIGSIRREALEVLAYVLRIYDADDYYDEWQADGFHRLASDNVAVYDAIDAGWPEYVRTIEADQPHEMRWLATLILPWLSERERSAAVLIDILSEPTQDEVGALEAQFADHTTSLLLRALGLVARGTPIEEIAERGIRSFIDAPGDIGLAASIALARLRRVDEEDVVVLERLGAAIESAEITGAMFAMYFDSLLLVDLHCAPRWHPESDNRHKARFILNEQMSPLMEPPGNDADGSSPLRQTDTQVLKSHIQMLTRHHRLAVGEPDGSQPAVAILPEATGRIAHSTAIDDTHFAFGDGSAVHIVSMKTLRAKRTLAIANEDEIAHCVIAQIDNPKRSEMADHWRDVVPTAMRIGELAASPDGRWLGAYGTGQIAIWDLSVAQRYPVAHLTGFTPTRVEFAWSPDSSRLVTKEASELHFWEVGDWSAPRQVVSAVGAKRLAWTGRHPMLFQGDGVYRWNVDEQTAERIELDDGEYALGSGPNGQILVGGQPVVSPGLHGARWDDQHWVQIETGIGQATLIVHSASGPRRIRVPGPTSWAQSVWWWPDGRFFVHQCGNSAVFRERTGDEVASCALVGGNAGDLVWLTETDEGPLLSTDRDDLINFYHHRAFDRPSYIDDPDEKALLLASHKNAQVIIARLRG